MDDENKAPSDSDNADSSRSTSRVVGIHPVKGQYSRVQDDVERAENWSERLGKHVPSATLPQAEIAPPDLTATPAPVSAVIYDLETVRRKKMHGKA